MHRRDSMLGSWSLVLGLGSWSLVLVFGSRFWHQGLRTKDLRYPRDLIWLDSTYQIFFHICRAVRQRDRNQRCGPPRLDRPEFGLPTERVSSVHGCTFQEPGGRNLRRKPPQFG